MKLMVAGQGKIVVSGRSEVANQEFVRSAILLSDLLHINEEKAASLLRHAISEQPVFDRDSLDVAILEYSRERLASIECISLLLQGATRSEVAVRTKKLFSFHLDRILGQTTDGVRLASTILRRLVELSDRVSGLRDDTTAAGALGGSQLKNAGLSEELIILHLNQLLRVRLALAELLLSLAVQQKLDASDMLTIFDSIKNLELIDPVWQVLFASSLRALQSFTATTIESESEPAAVAAKLKSLMNLVWGPLRWNSTSLQSISALQLGASLKKVRARFPMFDQWGVESVDSKVEQFLVSSPFAFCVERALSFLSPDSGVDSTAPASAILDRDTQDIIVETYKQLVIDFISTMGRIVRNLKTHAEDVPSRGTEAFAPDDTPPETSAFESLLLLTGVVHRYQPDAGLNFWTDSELRKFLKYLLDVRSVPLLRASLVLLSSLAEGPKSAEHAAQFLSVQNHVISWTAFFNSLSMSAQTLAAYPDREIHPKELALQQAFLMLLAQIARYSRRARITLYTNPGFQAINTLFALLNRKVSVDLKAALLQAIAAFAVPDEEVGTSEIAPAVWWHLEQAEIVPRPGIVSVDTQRFSSFGASVQGRPTRMEGIRYDLEQIESQNQTYPETIAFLTLLNVLMISSKNNPLSLNAIIPPSADNMAVPFSREIPVASKYVDFVVEDIFLKVHNRAFTSTTERWRMIASSLALFDQCVKAFDTLFVSGRYSDVTVAEPGSTIQSADVHAISSHPGFSVIARIMCGSPLLKRILDVLTNGVERVNEYASQCPPFSLAVKLSLRILLRVLGVQEFVLDLASLEHGRVLRVPNSLTGLDQLLAFYKDTVTTIALFVNCTVDDEINLLSVNILKVLSRSPVFNTVDTSSKNVRVNRLVGILSSSSESVRVVSGFVHRLSIEEPELPDSDESQFLNIFQDRNDGQLVDELFHEFSSRPAEVPGISNRIRLAILDLLVSNVAQQGAFPTVSHYLLGYNVRKAPPFVEIEEETISGRRSCLHVILNMLRIGTSAKSDGSDHMDADDAEVPLYVLHPKLGEKCYQLIYRICVDESTSVATMRFLRTTEDFFRRQLEAMPGDFLEDLEHPDLLVSQLHQRAWLLETLALELQLTSIAGQRSHVQSLLNLLFVSLPNQGGYQRGVRFEQPLTKMLDLLNSLKFEMAEPAQVDVETLLGTRDLRLFTQKDEYGRTVYNMVATYALVVERQKQFERSGGVLSAEDRVRSRFEIRNTMKLLLDVNQKVAEFGAWLHCLESWCKVTRTAFGKSFDAFPVANREEKAFEIMGAIFAKIGQNVPMEILERIASVVLQLVCQMYRDRTFQSILRSSSMASSTGSSVSAQGRLPVDGLLDIVLKGILNLLVVPGATSPLRTSACSALLYYLLYTGPDDLDSLEQPNADSEIPSPFASSRDSRSRPPLTSSAYRANLVVGNVAVIKGYGERLLESLCKDACRENEVGQITAFAVLEAIFSLPTQESPNRVLAFISARNYLSEFVGSLRKDDSALVMHLRYPDRHETMRAKYSFDGKMSFFLRLSKSKDGVERLVDSGVLDQLTDLEFIKDRPEASDDMDSDMYVPDASQVYNELLVQVLRLVSSIVVQSGRDFAQASHKVSFFITRHMNTFVAILRDRTTPETEVGREVVEELVSLFACMSSARAVLEAELNGPGFRTLDSVIVQTLIHFSQSPALYSDDSEVRRHHLLIVRHLLSFFEEATHASQGRPAHLAVATLFSTEDSRDGATDARLNPLASGKILDASVNHLLRLLDRHKSIKLKAQDLQRAPVDEINEIVERSGEAFITELSTAQRQQLARRQLAVEGKATAEELGVVLFIVEHWMLLLWRHIVHVSGTSLDRSSVESREMMRQVTASAVGKLQVVELPTDVVANPQARGQFLQMLGRKLRAALVAPS
ncbi:nucleoporin Nup186/Nup192/Nup205 [Zopfochytrium polystomum]|nr:nucleoporin Nup186/Nup192/Nup205 [Zopfochytrium polystomum]